MSRTTSGRALQSHTEVVQFDPRVYTHALRETWMRAICSPKRSLDGRGVEAYFDFCVEAALYAGCDRRAMSPPSTSAECAAGLQAWLQVSSVAQEATPSA